LCGMVHLILLRIGYEAKLVDEEVIFPLLSFSTP